MMTQLEIDDDLAARLEMAAKSRGLSFRAFAREALAQAASAPAAQAAPLRFTQLVHDFGRDLESPWAQLAELETEEQLAKFLRK